MRAAFNNTVANTAVYNVTLMTQAPAMVPLVRIKSFLKMKETAKKIKTEW